jgi:hypothetical protein
MAFTSIGGNYPRIKSASSDNSISSNGHSFFTKEPSKIDSVSLLTKNEQQVGGGSLFAYELPKLKKVQRKERKIEEKVGSQLFRLDKESNTENPAVSLNYCFGQISTEGSLEELLTTSISRLPLDISEWTRSTLFKGFKVRGWGGIFSPGAPGFPYVFRMPNKPNVIIVFLALYILIFYFSSYLL